MNGRTVTTRDVAEMRALAAEGLSRSAIAVIVDRRYETVARYVGAIVPPRPQPSPDVARYRRMLAAVRCPLVEDRAALAGRFGLNGPGSLKVMLVKARQVVAEADRRDALPDVRRSA